MRAIHQFLAARGVDLAALQCSEAEWEEACHLTEQNAPRVLPPRWRLANCQKGQPYAYQTTMGAPLSVLVSAARWENGAAWLHVSVSGRGRIPNYDELCEVKQIFVGEERQALHLFPPRSKHVNLNPFVLHLWACLEPEGGGLPDFGKAGTI